MSPEEKRLDPTEVRIFGRSYRLRGSENDAYLNRLAGLVDGKMREIAEATGTADSQKLAILACLNIADDFIRIEEAQGAEAAGELSYRSETDERLKNLVIELDEALAG